MKTTMFNSYLLVETDLLRKNISSIITSLCGKTELIPVLKDNAFGLGLIEVAKICTEFNEIKTIALAQIGEAIILRRAGIKSELLVMGSYPDFLNELAIENDITVTISRPKQLAILAAHARVKGKTVKTEIMIETGLHRTGFTSGDELQVFIDEFKEAGSSIEICGVYSHFADTNNKERTKSQYQTFINSVEQLNSFGIFPNRKHISSSAGYEEYSEYNLSAVRIGRRLYMDSPKMNNKEVEEVASFRSYITNIRNMKNGDTLGYGTKYFCDRDSIIASVGVGYGDGLNEALVKVKAPVLVNGKVARIMGCCMDQCQIDITDIVCKEGDEVTFFGRDSNGMFLSSQTVAALVGDNEGCGLTTALGMRVERIYI